MTEQGHSQKVDLAIIRECWPRVQAALAEQGRSVYGYLREGVPATVLDSTLTVGFPPGASFQVTMLESPARKAFVEKILTEVLGSPITVCFVLDETIQPVAHLEDEVRRKKEETERDAKYREEVRLAELNRLPPRYHKPWHGTPAQEIVVSRFKEEWPKHDLLVCGPVGTGKTWLLWTLHLWSKRKHHEWGYISTGQEFMRAFRMAWTPNHDNEEDIIKDATERSLLLLDEIGIGTDLPQEDLRFLQRYTNVLDTRWTWERPTVIASNLTPAALLKILGDRAASRFGARALRLVLDGPDRRKDKP